MITRHNSLFRPKQVRWCWSGRHSERLGRLTAAAVSDSVRVHVGQGRGCDPERNAFRNGQRARQKAHDFIVWNQLDRLVTLTYATAAVDERQVRRDLAAFARSLRLLYPPFAALGGAYLAVVEAGSGNGRLHAHLAIGQYVPSSMISAAWGHGFVGVTRFRGSFGSQAAGCAGYVAKYVGKCVPAGGVVAPGSHRYECSQGHQPVWEVFTVDTRQEVELLAREVLGDGPLDIWYSPSMCASWRGPPSVAIRRMVSDAESA